VHCSVLAEDAIRAALADYQKKHGVAPAPAADAANAAPAKA
jgi:nitrogen fixation NifU-like protein